MNDFYLERDIKEIVDNLGNMAKLLNGKNILITGGCGFIGRYLAAVFSTLNETVLSKPCLLLILDNYITSANSKFCLNTIGSKEIIEHNVIKPFETKEKLDYIIHAAGIASPYYYREYPLETLDVAVTGTRNMLELAKAKKARLLFFSSSEIYGDPEPSHVPIQESYRGNVSCLGARACYDEGKRVGETLCQIYHERFGVETVTVRPFNVYGPGMTETDYRVMPNFASRIKGGQPLFIYGNGSQTRTFCYVTDAMTGFILALVYGVTGQPYNIGNPKPEVSMLELVKRLEKASKKELQYNLIEYPDSYPADEPMRRCPNIKKARVQLKFNPKVDLDEGLRRFLSWTDTVYTGEM